MHYLTHRAINLNVRHATNRDICRDLQMPDATARGTFRRLAIRGTVRQRKDRAWELNIHADAPYEELAR